MLPWVSFWVGVLVEDLVAAHDPGLCFFEMVGFFADESDE